MTRPVRVDNMGPMLILLATLLALPNQDIPIRKGPEAKIVAMRTEPSQVKVGEVFKISLDLEITEGWYIYPTYPTTTGMPTEFALEGLELAGKIEEPKAKVHPAGAGLEAYDYHDGKITLTLPVYLKKGPQPGPFKVDGEMKYQICSKTCQMGEKHFSFSITVVSGEVNPPPKVDTEYESRGFVGLLLLGILGGLISLIMPCTYPLIPITLTYFVKQGGGSRRHGLLLSTVYSLGIILSFTGLGFLLTVLLGAGGARQFAASPWVNIAVGVLFLWFTGSMFGWYEIQLPFGLGSKLVGGHRKGVGGAFILGLLFSVVTFTCTIPIAATILTVAAGQHRLAAALAMLIYSATMALPFFIMGIFPGMIKEVPKSGGWLTTVKVSMGFVELGLAAFYLSKADQVWEFNVLTRTVVLGIYVGVTVIVALYLLRFFRALPSMTRLVGAVLFLGLGGFFAYGFAGKPLSLMETIIPPPMVHGTTFPEALKEAKEHGTPLFIEFTGIT